MFSAREMLENFVAVNYCFSKNRTTKNAFSTVCRYIDESVDLREVNAKAPFRGKVGPFDSKLDNHLRFSQVLRLHAIFHDAQGTWAASRKLARLLLHSHKGSVFLQQYASRTFLRNIVSVIGRIDPPRALRCTSILTIICSSNTILFSCILKWRYNNLIQKDAR